MTTRTLSWSALGLMICFGAVALGDQVFASSDLDVLGLGLFVLALLAAALVTVVGLTRLRAERLRALTPALIFLLGLWAGWPAAVDLGGWLREAWLRSDLATTEEVIRRSASDPTRSANWAAELPASVRAACNRVAFRTDSLGNQVAYCYVLRHLTYAYDPAGVTAVEDWQAREPFAPDWYRLLR